MRLCAKSAGDLLLAKFLFKPKGGKRDDKTSRRATRHDDQPSLQKDFKASQASAA